MSFTLDELNKLEEKQEKTRDNLFLAIEELRQQITDNAVKMEEYALNGDTESYAKLFATNEGLKASITAKLSCLKNLKPAYTEADIIDSWNTYVQDYNKKADKEIEKYKELKLELFKQFKKLVSMQNETISIRDDYKKKINHGESESNNQLIDFRTFEIIGRPNSYNTVDVQFFSDIADYRNLNSNGFFVCTDADVYDSVLKGFQTDRYYIFE